MYDDLRPAVIPLAADIVFLLPLLTDFSQHFKEISRSSSPIQRPFYHHLTSVVVGSHFCVIIFLSLNFVLYSRIHDLQQ